MRKRHSSSQSGFTLLELLLVIGVAGIVLLGITQITRSWVDGETSGSAGHQLARVSTHVQKYVEARFATLTPTHDAMTDGQAAGNPWADLRTILVQEGMIRNTPRCPGTLCSTLNVPLRISYVVDTVGGQNVYRATVFTTGSLPNKRVLQAARQAGNVGGTVTVMPLTPGSANMANGAFGQWQMATNRLMPGGVDLPCPRTATHGCLVAMISYNQETLCGPFLYRNDVESDQTAVGYCQGGNTMTTALNMNENNIQNAKEIHTEDLNVENLANLGTTEVNGTATFNGQTSAMGGLDVQSGMNVSGNASFSGAVAMNGGGNLNVTNLNATEVRSEKILTNNLNTEALDIKGTMNVATGITVDGNVEVIGGNKAVFATTLNVGSLNTDNGTIQTANMNVMNNMTIGGNVTINQSVTARQLNATKCIRLHKDNYGDC